MTQAANTSRPEGTEDDWDLESAERRPGAKRRSVVVSVRLSRDDFDRISRHAEASGVPTSTFLRNAALRAIVSA